MTFPPIGVTAVIAGMAVFNRDAAIVEGRLLNIGRVTRQLERDSLAGTTAAARAFTNFANTVTAASVVIAGAAVFAAASAIKFAADFEQGLTLTKAITGATDEEMARLEQTILHLTRNGTLGMNDLNSAATELARAGVPIEDVINGALEAVQNLVIASGEEIGLAKAGKLVATAMNAFGLGVEEVDRITTAATVVAQNSALTFTDFGTAVQYAGATFQAAGFSIEDLALSTALLGKNGITGSVAATSLRGVIQRLIKPSNEAQKVMDQYGISLFDSAGKANGLDVVLQQLRDAFGDEAVATGKLTEEERLHAIATLGLQRTGAAFLILANATTDELDELRDSFKRLNVRELVEIQLQALNAIIKVAENNIIALSYAFGKVFVEALKGPARELLAFLKGLKEADFAALAQNILNIGASIRDTFLNTVQTVRDFADAFGLTGPAIELFRNALIGVAAIVVTKIVVGILAAIAAFTAFLVIVGLVTTAVIKIHEALQPFLATLPSIGEILGGLSTKLAETGAAWAPWAAQAGSAGQIVSSVLSGVSGVVEALQFILQGNFPAAAESARGALANFGVAGQVVVDEFNANVLPVLQVIGTAFMQAFDWIINTGLPAFAAGVATATGFLNEHREILVGVVAAFVAFKAALAIVSLVQGVTAAITALTAAITGAGSVIGLIVAVLGGPLTLAIVGIALAVGVLTAAWIGNWGDIQGKVQAVVATITTTASRWVSDLTDSFRTIANVAVAAWDFIVAETIREWNLIPKLVGAAVQAVVGEVTREWDRVLEITQAVWDAIPANIREDLVAIVNGVQEILSLVPVIAAVQWNRFVDAATEILTPAVEVVRAIIELISQAIQAKFTEINTGAQNAWQQFTDNATAILNVGSAAIQMIWGALTASLIATGEQAAVDIIGPATQFVTNVGNTISEFTGYAVAAASSLASAIVSGFVNGIMARVGEITAAARSMVESALGAARAAAQAQSPSKATQELGEDLAEGLEEGLEEGSYDVVAEAEAVVGRVETAIVDRLDAAKRPVRGTAASLVDQLLYELQTIDDRGGQLLQEMEAKMTQIGEEVGRKIIEATIDAQRAVGDVIDAANERIQEMLENLAQSRSDRGRRDALRKDQDARRRARKEGQEDVDAQEKRTRDLTDAEFKLQQDLEKATTDEQRKEAQVRYEQKIADIERDFTLDEQRRLEQRQREADDAEFERKLEEETRALEDALENESLQRSIARAQADRDARIAAINEALAEKTAKIREDARIEIEELRENTHRKIQILEEEFARKAADVLRKGGEEMRPLVDNIQSILSGNFEAMRTAANDFTTSVEDAIGALKRLEDARRDAEFAAPSIPSPTAGLGGEEPNYPPGHGPQYFQHGGVVPGPWGKPLLAVVHGGEFIAGLHSEAARMLRAMDRGLPTSIQNEYNYNVKANYANTQSEASVEMDMRALILMARG